MKILEGGGGGRIVAGFVHGLHLLANFQKYLENWLWFWGSAEDKHGVFEWERRSRRLCLVLRVSGLGNLEL